MSTYDEISRGISGVLAILFAFLSLFGVLSNSYNVEEGKNITYTTWEEDVSTLLSMCDDSPLTDCGGDCGHAPTIIVPGIGQSEAFLYDENNEIVYDENGKPVTGWPLYINSDKLINKLAAPLVTAIATQQDNGFTDYASKAISEEFSVNQTGLDGLPVNNVHVTKYYKSVEACNEDEKEFIYNSIPINKYAELCGEDHLYYFAYNSFGDTLGVAEELYAYIQMVKAQTGHDKINIVPISLGGTVFNALLELHPEVSNDLERVICIVPALDGSKIVSDVYGKNLSFEDVMLYRDLIPSLMEDDYFSYVINLAIRTLPKQVVVDLLDKTVDELIGVLLQNCPSMWALVASEDYPALAEKYLSDSDHDYLRERTGVYYSAQINSDSNILALKEAGVEVFDVVDYGVQLYTIAASWDNYNADGIIHVDSTSMGAYTCLIGDTLGAGYVQKGTNCSDHDHISPDNTLDASSGLLPDTTFYFYQQNHESTGRNNMIMNLAVDLLVDDSITSVYSDPRYPQFMYARNTRGFFRSDVPDAEKILAEEAAAPGTYDPQLVADTGAALDKAYYMEQNGTVKTDEVEAIKSEVYDCLVRAGKRTVDTNEQEDKTDEYLAKFLKAASDGAYEYYGPIGYSDYEDAEFWAIIDAYKTMK